MLLMIQLRFWLQDDARFQIADPICTFVFALLVLWTTRLILQVRPQSAVVDCRELRLACPGVRRRTCLTCEASLSRLFLISLSPL